MDDFWALVLTPGKRTVSAVLRIMGLAQASDFALYHHVLSQARWDGRAIARKLLMMILDRFLPAGPVIIGIRTAISSRRAACAGSMIPLPFARRHWALPFLTILSPSQRYDERKGRRHKSLVDWARQGILQIRRWLPDRLIIIVADSSFAAIELIAAVRRHVCFITRLRLDANLFAPPPECRRGRGRPAKKGRKLPKLADILADPTTVWTTIVMAAWYGGKRCRLEFVSGTAIWYHAGSPPLPIRWVLVRDPAGIRKPQAFWISQNFLTHADVKTKIREVLRLQKGDVCKKINNLAAERVKFGLDRRPPPTPRCVEATKICNYGLLIPNNKPNRARGRHPSEILIADDRCLHHLRTSHQDAPSGVNP